MAKYALPKTVAWAERAGKAGKAGQQLGHRIRKLVYKSPSLNTDRPSWTVNIPYRKADVIETAILLTLFLHRLVDEWETLPQYDDTDEKWTFTTPENLLDASIGGNLDGFSLKHHETCINVLSHVACRILSLPMDEGTRTQAVRSIRKVVQNPAIRSGNGRTGIGGSSKPCLIRRNGLYTNEAFSFVQSGVVRYGSLSSLGTTFTHSKVPMRRAVKRKLETYAAGLWDRSRSLLVVRIGMMDLLRQMREAGWKGIDAE